jgi:hypothetical protein
MPLLTRAELERQAKPESRIAKDLGNVEAFEENEKPKSKDKFRMYHPDDPAGRMNVTFHWGDATVQVKNGAAVVAAAVADELEKQGWRRGAKIDKEEWV